ncbi:MAG TPA: TetR family transcriptional regulator [Candidatus Hydrogenedentes bacterium]|nr:TetR family transcriptional regulator [Candidatus Hydrogenedentota bacterium]
MPNSVASYAQARWDRDRHRKVNDILDAAERLFRAKGYRVATTDDIARDSGYSVGTIYNIFQNKEELYAQVIERIGQELLKRFEYAVASKRNPSEAIEALIILRLSNFSKDRLFFQPFSCDGDLSIPPDSSQLPKRVIALYEKYIHSVSALFRRAIEREGVKDINPLHLTLALEGMINAFIGYWSKPEQPDALAHTARQIKDILLSPIGYRRLSAQQPPASTPQEEERGIYISKFDLDRLKELIEVARCFGRPETRAHLDVLNNELSHAHVVKPKEVPPDLVTMNSRVSLLELDSGRNLVLTLAFPKDADVRRDSVSILDALGTALLGKRLGDVFDVKIGTALQRYKVERILYQPEFAGDYHL